MTIVLMVHVKMEIKKNLEEELEDLKKEDFPQEISIVKMVLVKMEMMKKRYL